MSPLKTDFQNQWLCLISHSFEQDIKYNNHKCYFFSCQYESMLVLKETHSKWHLVTDYNRVWRRHNVMQSPNFGRSLGFTAISLPKTYLIDENNLSFWTFMNQTLQTLNYTYRGEIHFSYLNLGDEYASRIKCPRCLANLNYNKSKCSD